MTTVGARSQETLGVENIQIGINTGKVRVKERRLSIKSSIRQGSVKVERVEDNPPGRQIDFFKYRVRTLNDSSLCQNFILSIHSTKPHCRLYEIKVTRHTIWCISFFDISISFKWPSHRDGGRAAHFLVLGVFRNGSSGTLTSALGDRAWDQVLRGRYFGVTPREVWLEDRFARGPKTHSMGQGTDLVCRSSRQRVSCVLRVHGLVIKCI